MFQGRPGIEIDFQIRSRSYIFVMLQKIETYFRFFAP